MGVKGGLELALKSLSLATEVIVSTLFAITKPVQFLLRGLFLHLTITNRPNVIPLEASFKTPRNSYKTSETYCHQFGIHQ